MNKKIPLIILIILVVAGAVFVTLAKRNHFLYAGTVEATEVDLSARLTGVIAAITVQEGDRVTKGQKLLTLSIDDIAVAAAAAERDYQRAVSLLKAGSLNQEAFDKIKFRRDDAAVRLSWGTINAPIDGTVITRYHEPGEMVNPGTKLLTISDLSKPWAHIYVPQPMLAQINVGMNVTGYSPEANMKAVTGTVVRINDEAEFTPKNVQTRKERTRLVYGVKILFENASGFLKPGMTVEVALPEK